MPDTTRRGMVASGGPTFESQQRYWDERWNCQRMPNAWQLKRGNAALDMVRSLSLASTPRILDLGCATGWFTAQLAFLGDVTGIDLSPAAIEMARHDFPGVNYIAGNVFEMSLRTNHYDVVVSQEVIAHVPDQAAFVRHIARMLKPRGHLIITTANKFVMDRVVHPPDSDAHIKTWLDMGAFKRLLRPHFRILRSTSVIPMGDQGILRVINSAKLSSILATLFSAPQVESWKERARLGYSLIVLAQRVS